MTRRAAHPVSFPAQPGGTGVPPVTARPLFIPHTGSRGAARPLHTPRRDRAAARGAAVRAFSLIELIVVIVLLTIVAGAIAPRLIASSGRQAEASVRSAAALLSTAAHRDAVGGGDDSLAIVHDERAGTLSLETLRREKGSNKAEWKRDRFTRPVELNPARIRTALADGRELPRGDWRIEFGPGEQRPTIELIVEAEAGRDRRAWYLELLPYDTAAKLSAMSSSAAIPASASLRSIDLDAEGKGESPW